jgi:membrane protein implicated in regulation of membrane protease activity
MDKENKKIERLKLEYDLNKVYAFSFFAALLVISFGFITKINFFLLLIVFALISVFIIYYRNKMLESYNSLIDILR